MMIQYFRLIACAFAMLFGAAAQAQLNIEVVGAGMQRISVAVPNFGGDETLGREIATTVRKD